MSSELRQVLAVKKYSGVLSLKNKNNIWWEGESVPVLKSMVKVQKAPREAPG